MDSSQLNKTKHYTQAKSPTVYNNVPQLLAFPHNSRLTNTPLLQPLNKKVSNVHKEPRDHYTKYLTKYHPGIMEV
jgi:hypothetical protein